MAGDPRRRRAQPEVSDDGADAELLARIGRGERDALRSLYLKYYYPLLRFTYRVTGQLELAQEAINDAMLVVWQDARAFEGRSRVSTWIMGIAYRKALKLGERSRRWTQRFAAGELDEAAERLAREEEPNQQAELGDLLEQALEALPAEQRAVVELTYFFGCSYEEISKIAGCPVNTVKTRMFHARAKLKKLLPRLGKDELAP